MKPSVYIKQIQQQRDALGSEFDKFRSYATTESQGYKNAVNTSGAASYSKKQADQMNRLRSLMGDKNVVTASADPTHATSHDFGGSNVYELAKQSGFNPASIKRVKYNK